MKLSALAKRMVLAILALTLACIVAAALYYRSLAFVPFLWGALLGGAVSVFKVFLLERAVNKAMALEKSRIGSYISLQYLLRLGISAAAMLLGALIAQISLWGVVAGILAYQLALYVIKLLSKKQAGADKPEEVNDS